MISREADEPVTGVLITRRSEALTVAKDMPYGTINLDNVLNGVSGTLTVRQRADGARENLWPPRKLLTNPRDEEILTFDAPGRSWAYAIWEIPDKEAFTHNKGKGEFQ